MIETLNEAKRANDLNERLTKGTYGAVFDVEAAFSESTVTLIFRNRGKVISRKLNAAGEIVLKRIPGYAPIGRPQTLMVSGTQIKQDGGEVYGRTHFEGFTKADADRVSEWKEALSIEGKFTYDNGLGDTVSDSFCFLHVRWATGNGQLVMRPLRCDDAKESVRVGPLFLRNAKKK